MDLSWDDELRDFQQEVRDWLRANLPADIKAKVDEGRGPSRDDLVRWQKMLHEKGWIAPAWPTEYGGTGWDVVRRYIFAEEMAAAGSPRLLAFGLSMVGPVIYTFGSDEQKQKYLPRILASDDWWCQGYSEPGSGSDLASVSTKAVREGDHYVVNGTKTWTTLAQHADHMFCLARTDTSVKPQEGISFLLIDMRQPGVEVKPIVTIDGSAEVNMVYLTDVKVPVEDRVGEENKGWTYAKFLLGHERFGIAGIGRSKAQLERLKRIAAMETAEAEPLIEDRDFAHAVADVELELTALEYTELRLLLAARDGQVGAEPSLLKVKGTEVQQMLTELLMRAVGYYAAPYSREAMTEGWNEAPIGPAHAFSLAPTYFNWRKVSIYGGTNEIQKNIMAKMVLGM
ncbi:MAG: acyl-CoA dehydrogenase family protein [Alphaproteobacteria bacterium]